jgi:hypothetical protein
VTEPRRSRPRFPTGYGIARGEEGLLPWTHVRERMERSRSYWICSARPDGRPHAMPVWGVWVDERLYFSSDPGSVKATNLAANPALVVHLESGDDCVILEGLAEPVIRPERALFDRIAAAYGAKYGPFPLEYPTGPGWFAVRPRVAFAWLESSYPTSATRWTLD